MMLEFGDGTPVTRHNRHAYVRGQVQQLVESRRAALECIREGFQVCGEALNRLVRTLTWRDVRVLLTGPEHLEPGMVLERLQFLEFAADSSVPEWVRETVRTMTTDQLKKLLLFTTHQPSLPLQLVPDPIKVCPSAAPTTSLPTAASCFWKLEIPAYSSRAELAEKLLRALDWSDGSFARDGN